MQALSQLRHMKRLLCDERVYQVMDSGRLSTIKVGSQHEAKVSISSLSYMCSGGHED